MHGPAASQGRARFRPTAPDVQDPSAEAGWTLVAGDVFREPAAAVQLASLFGGGVHVLCTAAATLMLAALGLLSPAHRGALLTTAILLYALLSVAGGYLAVLLWRNLARSASQDSSQFSHWGWVCFKAAVELPGAQSHSPSLLGVTVHEIAQPTLRSTSRQCAQYKNRTHVCTHGLNSTLVVFVLEQWRPRGGWIVGVVMHWPALNSAIGHRDAGMHRLHVCTDYM